jgi:hypothetical protein
VTPYNDLLDDMPGDELLARRPGPDRGRRGRNGEGRTSMIARTAAGAHRPENGIIRLPGTRFIA